MPETPTNGNGTPAQQVDPAALAELRSLVSDIRNLEGNVVLARMQWGRQHGVTHGGARDTYQIFGYDDVITTHMYRAAYDRGGIAGSIVDVMPDATWRGELPFELIEDDNPENKTEFEQAWIALEKEHQLNAKFLRIDKLSRLSTYAVLLIGADGEWDTELPKVVPGRGKIHYFQPYFGGGGPGGTNPQTVAAGADATVYEYETDKNSPRFGQPKSYTIKRTDMATVDWGRPVHWTRVHHVAEGLLDNEVFGQPALERVWNLLLNLDKVTGGGSEAFWLRANQGLHIDLDKDMALESTAATIAALKEKAEAYKHQLTRWLETRGTKVTPLGSDVANFGPPADAIITQIAGAKRIPKRILTGSEMGELASSQDRENFRDQIIGRQTQYAGPYIIKPLIDRLIQYGYLPTPKKAEGYTIRWPHIQVLTEGEKADGAQKWAGTKVGEDPVFTSAEIRDHFHGMAPLSDEQLKELDERKQEQAELKAEAQKLMAPKAPPESSKPPFLKAAAAHKFSTTQVQLPSALADNLIALGKSIPGFDLCEEEGGREEDAHITVKYGLHTNDAADIRKVLATYVGPIRITLGKTAIFEGDGYDVLYVEVKSQDLYELNARLADKLEATDTYPAYRPHATVAYLKKGSGVKYVGLNALEGMSASIGSVRFSSAEGVITDLRITGRSEKGSFAVVRSAESAEDMEVLSLLTAAIECGNKDVVARLVGLGDFEGHPFRGNQYDEGAGEGGEPKPAGGNSSGKTDRELEEKFKALPDRTVVLKSKYGEVQVEKRGEQIGFRGRRKNGDAEPWKGTLREAKQSLRGPREADRDRFRSGWMKPDVMWKEAVK